MIIMMIMIMTTEFCMNILFEQVQGQKNDDDNDSVDDDDNDDDDTK